MSSTLDATTRKIKISPQSDQDVISAMPFLQRNPNNVWMRATNLRDILYQVVETACTESKIKALVNRSIDFTYPAWVSLETWLPAGAPGATHRHFCSFSIAPKPYSRFEFEITVFCRRDGKEGTFGPYSRLTTSKVAEWTQYMLDAKPKPATGEDRIRKHAWQFWLPKNKIVGLGGDSLIYGANTALVAGIVLAQAGEIAPAAPIAGVIGLVTWAACLAIAHHRRTVTVNAGRPSAEPRTLRLVDNWSTMANGLGDYWEEVRDRLFHRLSEGVAVNIQSRLEDISYLTPDGKQERKQLVLSQGRGTVFCHVYPYGEDLYIGWDAHLNYGQWVEAALDLGYDPKLGSPAVIKTVIPGISRVTEYDLIDLNSLTEWTHSRFVQLIKQVMAEHSLDQEIDFKILRGERQSLLRDQETKKKRPFFSINRE